MMPHTQPSAAGIDIGTVLMELIGDNDNAAFKSALCKQLRRKAQVLLG